MASLLTPRPWTYSSLKGRQVHLQTPMHNAYARCQQQSSLATHQLYILAEAGLYILAEAGLIMPFGRNYFLTVQCPDPKLTWSSRHLIPPNLRNFSESMDRFWELLFACRARRDPDLQSEQDSVPPVRPDELHRSSVASTLSHSKRSPADIVDCLRLQAHVHTIWLWSANT